VVNNYSVLVVLLLLPATRNQLFLDDFAALQLPTARGRRGREWKDIGWKRWEDGVWCARGHRI